MRKGKSTASYSGGHVADSILLLALSGELGSQESDRVREHLEACWTCRVRTEKFERAIQDVVDYRDELVKPLMPLPDASRAMFLARLEEAAKQVEQKTPWQRMKSFVSLPARSEIWRPAIVAGAACILVIVLLGRFLTPAPTRLSADDLLLRADHEQKSRFSFIAHPVVYRELSVRYNGRMAKTTVYHDSVSNKTVDVSATAQEVKPEVESRLNHSHFDLREPLSVPAYIAWRGSLTQKHDDIIHSANGLTTVQTTTVTGPLREVALTLRDSDYHPLAESFRFDDQDSVEIAELNYDVLPFAKVRPGIFTPVPTDRSAIAMAHIPVGPSTKDLLESEVKARVLLHVLGADQGEQIDVSIDDDSRKVVVSGLVETGARKEELLRALEVVPFAQLNLTSVEDADDEYVADAATDRVVIANGFGTPLDTRLTSSFPDPAARAQFVDTALSQARKALNTAWALRRLSDRYSSDVTSRLSPNAQRELEVLIRAQLESLESQLKGLGKSLGPVLPATTPGGESDSTDASDWHWLVDRAFSSTERIHSDVAVLLSGSASDNVDRDAIVSDLRSQLDRMSTQLPAFSRRVSGKFLTPSQLNAEVR
ncbi:MAG TPA: hypothetical protein VGL89_12070 [Candidatus Koribacter sp.]|jgi:hypothetical protein